MSQLLKLSVLVAKWSLNSSFCPQQSAKVALLGWFEVCEYEEQLIGTSDTGYINNKLCFQWIQHFHLATPERRLAQLNFSSVMDIAPTWSMNWSDSMRRRRSSYSSFLQRPAMCYSHLLLVCFMPSFCQGASNFENQFRMLFTDWKSTLHNIADRKSVV